MTNFGMHCAYIKGYNIMYKMIRLFLLYLCASTTLLLSTPLFAIDKPEPPEVLTPEHEHESWVFAGIVSNENSDNYGYFFSMQRNGDEFYTIAALIDAQTKQVILLDENKAHIAHPEPFNWPVGRSFLRFNPINNSWIFGLKTNDKKGFNFKVDMLKQSEIVPVVQGLRPGVELLINQTHHLNGHLKAGTDHKEEFVTAKNAWFRQVWLTNDQQKSYAFSGVLCRFNDGSGFYSVKMPEADAQRAAIAGWRDEEGTSVAMSQFVNVNQDTAGGPWHIRVTSPNLHLMFMDDIKKESVVAGFIMGDKRQGFCMLSKDVLGGGASS